MFIHHIKKNYYYLISLLIFLYLISSNLIISPFKPITMLLFFLIIFFLVIQNLNHIIKTQITFFLIFSYLLMFFLDFNIEKLIFKSCVRGSCYQDYINNNEDRKLKINLLGKNFISDDLEILPLNTFPNQKILGSNENGYWPIFRSDRFGFNNSDKIYENKVINNLIIGDSFAQSATVSYDKSIQGILNYRKYKTITFGVGGNGPLLNLATFIEYAKITKFENLIYFFTETNDLFYDVSVEKKNRILRKYLEKNFSQNLLNKKKEILKLLEKKNLDILIKNEKKDKLTIKKILRPLTLPNTRFILNVVNTGEENDYNSFEFPENLEFSNKDFLENSIQSNFRIQNKVLEKINNTTNNVNLFLLYIPDKKYFLKNKKTKMLDMIKKISKKNNFQFINLYDEINLNDRKNMFPNNYQHFNEIGQKKIAEILINKIES